MTKTMFLVAAAMFAATGACAQSVGSQTWVPDLSGIYRCVHKCSGVRFVHVQQNNRELAVSEGGQAATAWIGWSGHISTSWNDSGVYSPSGNTIQFVSGTVWVLVQPTPVSGEREWFN
jgi:hypothetical protein